MTLPKFTHMAPSSLDEALDLLNEKGEKTKVIAGGSDLMVQLKHRTTTPEFILDIKDLTGLEGINTGSDGKMIIGALTTLDTLSESEQIKEHFPILARAALKVASSQIRNVGTLGGNVCLNTRCWYYNQTPQWREAIPACYKMGGDECLVIKNSDKCNAVFLADTVPALIALDAELKILKKGGERTIPIEQLYNGSGHPSNLLGADEILGEIQIPATPKNTYSVFIKDAPREVVDFAIVNMAMCVTFKGNDGICERARIAAGGVTSGPVRSIKGEDALKGQKITDTLADEVADLVVKDAAPISPIWVSPSQRRQTLRTFVKRQLMAALAYNQGN
jgi:4-hydroxybenzoyl-CoA reductase subunit beta